LNIFTTVGGQQHFNYDGLRTDEQAQAYYGMEFPNYWNLRSFYIHHPVVEDDRLTRGGPAVKRSGYNFGHFQVSTDARQRAVFDVTFEGSRGVSAPTHMFYFAPGIALKPAASVFIQLSPGYSADEDAAQYVQTVSDPTATAFGGNRYVFAFIKTKTVSFDTRVNWTLKPDVTLQLYAQPFFASGAYSGFREFAAPRTLRKLEYGRDIGSITTDANGNYSVDPDSTATGNGPAARFTIGKPDFSYRALRGTAVLRWEYRPGSTMFFVWTQQREGSTSEGNYEFRRDYSSLFRDRPDNVFLIKATYWIGR
jgi:hypothetical protein